MLSREQLNGIRDKLGQSDSRLSYVFGALGDVSRFQIFKLLMKYDDLCVTDVANVLQISVPAASQQLKVMEMSGLVNKERHGQMICYRIKKDDPIIKSLAKILIINK